MVKINGMKKALSLLLVLALVGVYLSAPTFAEEPQVDEAVEAVRAQIAALPEAEAAAIMSDEELGGWNDTIQAAYSAYSALNGEQRALLTAEGEKIYDLLGCLNDPSRIMPLSESAEH